MVCPFLRETSAWSCQSVSIRKLIPQMKTGTAEDRCRTAHHRECPGFSEPADCHAGTQCPFLRESLVQYCAASPVTRFIPYSEAMLSRCGSGAYRYCDLYLDFSRAAETAATEGEMPIPDDLLYSSNHMWIDLSDSGPWHVGVDAFLARLMHPAARVTYLSTHGSIRPAVVVSVGSTDLHLEFPEVLEVQSGNSGLRSQPARLTAEPYSHGWLFEGLMSPKQRDLLKQTLLSPEQARRRLEADCRRVREWAEERVGAACDGGLFERGVLQGLTREEALLGFHRFCAPCSESLEG